MFCNLTRRATLFSLPHVSELRSWHALLHELAVAVELPETARIRAFSTQFPKNATHSHSIVILPIMLRRDVMRSSASWHEPPGFLPIKCTATPVGYKARGDAKLLRQLGEERGMRVSIVDLRDAAYQNASETCSSSRVRESLQMGDVQRVHSHLDRPYAIVVACEALHLDSSNPGAWKFSGADALTQIPAAARYHANVCSGSAKVCAAQVVLNVGETGGWAEMDGARLCMPGGYIRFELLSRAD